MRSRPWIEATTRVPAPPEEVFTFLADLEGHWVLAGRFVEVLSLARGDDGRARGGRVRMRGPLGTHRTASTQVLVADRPHEMVGIAEVGRRTHARVRWKLTGSDHGTRVSIMAAIEDAGRLDRLLLLLGGRAWLERRFGGVLGRLAQRFGTMQVEPRPRTRNLQPI